MTSIRRLLWLLPLGLLALLAVAAYQVSQFAERDETRPADAAIVLGAGVWRERPSPVLRERINHAVALYEQGLVDRLIFTGGVGRNDISSEAAVAARYARERGVPAEAMLLEELSTNTYENLVNASGVAEEAGLESFLIVSTPYHMKRALALASDVGLEAYSSPTRSTRWISERTRRFSYVRETIVYFLYLLERPLHLPRLVWQRL